MYVSSLILQISNEAVEHPQFLFLWDFFICQENFAQLYPKNYENEIQVSQLIKAIIK